MGLQYTRQATRPDDTTQRSVDHDVQKTTARQTGRTVHEGFQHAAHRQAPTGAAQRRDGGPLLEPGVPPWMKVVGGIAAVGLVGAFIYALQRPVPTAFGTVAVLISEDANVAGNGLEQIKDQVTDAAVELAQQGGGELVIAKAGGGPAQQVATHGSGRHRT